VKEVANEVVISILPHFQTQNL